MRRLIYISNWLYLFSLALWVGGMFLLGILVEIIVRVKLKEQPQLASDIMNGIMDIFNIKIIYWCLGIMVAVVIIKFFVARNPVYGFSELRNSRRPYLKEIFLGIMVVLALYIGSVLRPQMHDMDKMKKANPEDIRLQKQFDSYHSQLTWLYTVNMILGLSLFYIHGKEMARFRDDS
jgi:uncharacterized membrane protein YedE/YeeE